MRVAILNMSSNMQGLEEMLDCEMIQTPYELITRCTTNEDFEIIRKSDVAKREEIIENIKGFKGFLIGGSNLYHDMTYHLLKNYEQVDSLLVFDEHADMRSQFADSSLNFANFERFALEEGLVKKVIVYGLYDMNWAKCAPKGFSAFNTGCDFSQVTEPIKGEKVYVSVDLDGISQVHHDSPIFNPNVMDGFCAADYYAEGKVRRKELIYYIKKLSKKAEIVGGDCWGITNSHNEHRMHRFLKDAFEVSIMLAELFKTL